MVGVWGQQQVPAPAAERSQARSGESPAHLPKCWHSPGRRFPPCLPGITVCVGMGRRKNMMGNREIKITR